MKTLINSETNPENLLNRNSTVCIREKNKSFINVLDLKFYQKSFMVFMACSIFLIFPDSPNQLEEVCVRNYSQQICDVW